MRSVHKMSVALAAAATLVLAACSGSGGDASANGPVTLTWWHNRTTEPMKTIWQQIADDFHKSHPDVSFTIEPLQNEQFQTKMPLALQGSTPPDIFQQWGGGSLKSQLSSGKIADITQASSSWIGPLGQSAKGWQVDGKQYGVPYQMHAVGFWYRKDLFATAGVTSPPSTLDELNAAVTKLKAAKLVPIAVGGKDRWPDAFYYNYFAIRQCSVDALKKAVEKTELADPCFTKAGENLKAFLDTKPFQDGFVGTPAQQGAGSSAGMLANGQAAMELQGDWNPDVMQALSEDKDLDSKIGWFPFPSVPGGQGDPAAVLGGGDGFSCTSRAAKACADFMGYLVGEEVQKKLAATGSGLPVHPAAVASLKTETHKQIAEYTAKAPHLQFYLDIAFPTNVGQALNDAIANFFAGQGGPDTIVQSVTKAAAGNK
ncbi:carbohydrate ABC transporter substrate-binding protein (CUT1 family) [Lentzea atacamensis]|uniref:Carbohydrate ABC transporter substrate-binding protein (CUT1 family) n=2 Tax=Lentzea TaxID=165301 RepID=A0A316HM62_9PSEU|nr:extracellular solute-binding protein [Lentzea atacamensis]PWK81410.1 carbohydrate ABC transporter substrate-binding protein (CUT1 family) [Lentzea atacamensis]RAS70557.1 carbohydrate ABC transporter substrate-binding protein (CUT1 family) [Lentzea atacamensis]